MDLISQPEWEESYSSDSFRNKNEYPSLEIVSFLMRKYGGLSDRSHIKGLDLGCGWGNNLKFLKEKGFDYSGVDFSESAIKHCSKEHKNVFCCSLDNLPFPNDTFDFAFDRMAIQHNEPKIINNIFDEVYRVLKKDGVFYSILVEKAEFDYYTTYMSVDDIKKLAKKFNHFELDYQEFTIGGGKNIFRSNILTAIK